MVNNLPVYNFILISYLEIGMGKPRYRNNFPLIYCHYALWSRLMYFVLDDN